MADDDDGCLLAHLVRCLQIAHQLTMVALKRDTLRLGLAGER